MMKKFNFRKVLDGLTAASSPAHPGSGGLGSGAGGSGGGVSSGGGSGSSGGGGGTSGGGRGGAGDAEIPETLTSDHFQICKTVRHGFPCQPTALAFDPVQKILAIGCRTGALRIVHQSQKASNESVSIVCSLGKDVSSEERWASAWTDFLAHCSNLWKSPLASSKSTPAWWSSK